MFYPTTPRRAGIPSGTTVPPIYSEAEEMAFIRRQWSRQSDGEGLSLVIGEQATSTAVGLIALLFRPSRGGRSRVLGHTGRAWAPIASRAVALLSPWALKQASIRRLEAFVDPENLASIRALEDSGFQKEGLLRSYLNGTQEVHVYSMLASDLGNRGVESDRD